MKVSKALDESILDNTRQVLTLEIAVERQCKMSTALEVKRSPSRDAGLEAKTVSLRNCSLCQNSLRERSIRYYIDVP